MKARAFCPAHITGFFKAELDEKDPNRLGSLGAGFSIQKGVKTTVILVPEILAMLQNSTYKLRDSRLVMSMFQNMY